MLATSDLAVYGYKENKNPWSYPCPSIHTSSRAMDDLQQMNAIILALSQNSQVETFPVLNWRFLQF